MTQPRFAVSCWVPLPDAVSMPFTSTEPLPSHEEATRYAQALRATTIDLEDVSVVELDPVWTGLVVELQNVRHPDQLLCIDHVQEVETHQDVVDGHKGIELIHTDAHKNATGERSTIFRCTDWRINRVMMGIG